MKVICCFFFFFSFLLSQTTITHIKIHNAISPGTAQYLKDAFLQSKEDKTSLMLIELDTPGGLATSMREMIQNILNSDIPVIMFVSPKGSRAASAGTYLMYASHIAAMTPGSNIGAATPVNLMQAPKAPKIINKEDDKNDSLNKKISNNKTAMEKKVINDAIAYIKSIAEFKNRNISWAIEAVKEGKSISAQEALKLNVIDFVALDVDDLLKQINNKEVFLNGEKVRINTKNRTLKFFEASFKTEVLMIISNPSFAYAFLILAMYGIFFEMMNPGSIFPGVIGAFFALLSMYALNILPFSYVGLLLILLGIAFMLSEVFISGFGILGLVGLISFTLGSFMLFDEQTLGQDISSSLIISFSLVSLAFFVFLMAFLLKIRKKDPISGIHTLIGVEVEILSTDENNYKVSCNGEIWNAISVEKLKINEKAIITNIKSLILEIRRIK